MEKKYIYKYFNTDGYIGVIDKVQTEFNLSQEINSAGSQIQFKIGISLDEANPTSTSDMLVDSLDVEVVDNNGENIVGPPTYSISNVPDLNNKVEVWEFSTDNINGKLMFTGLVSKWRYDDIDNTIEVTCLSYGVQLDNYLVQILPETAIEEHITDETQYTLDGQGSKGGEALISGLAQSFQISTPTDISKVNVSLGNASTSNADISLLIFQGTPDSPGSFLSSVSRILQPQEQQMTSFQLPTSISLLSSTDYFFRVLNFTSGVNVQVTLGYDATGSYANGDMYTWSLNSGYTLTADDLKFEIITTTGAVGNVFNSYDPSDMAREMIDTLQSLGSEVNYDSSSLISTNTSVSYTFKFNTYLEAIRKCVELAPSDWYWYIDPADSKFYFDYKRADSNHTLHKGKHIKHLDLTYSLEDVRNKVYYSGGDDGTGTNVLVTRSNTDSVSNYGNWLQLESDNRVTLEDTATTLAESILNELSQPKFITSVEVHSTDYDITSFKIGQIVTFRNYNTLIDSLNLQIFAKHYTPNSVTLDLALLPPTQSKRIEDIRRNLNKQETIDNPDE